MEDFKKKGHSHQKPTQENPRVNNFAERRFQGIIKQMRLDNSKFLRQANLGLFDHNSLVRHLEIAEEYSGDTSRKSLSQKNTGKFYTPPEIALPLIEQVLKILNLNTKNELVEPTLRFLRQRKVVMQKLKFFLNKPILFRNSLRATKKNLI